MAKPSKDKEEIVQPQAILTECSKGHKMLSTAILVNVNPDCSECKTRRTFVYVHPDRAAMWDAKANKRVDPKKLLPEDISLRFFTCNQGHRFRRNPWGRARRGFCPLCLDFDTEN